MSFDKQLTRGDISALVPEEVSNAILEDVQAQSAALASFRRIPMSSKQTRLPVLSALPTAYWVDGDTGLKQTTEMAWSNKFITAEELAVIVPVPEAVLSDAGFDVFAMIRPMIAEAIARKLDAAVFLGEDAPASWPTGIVPGAIAAGHSVARGTNAANKGGLSADLNDAFSLVEADGFGVNAVMADVSYRGKLRSVRNASGDRLAEVSPEQVYGVPVAYPMRGMWSNGVEAIVGDATQGIIAIRQDLTFKVLDQAVITDNTGAVVLNLAQQDAVALRVVARYGFQVANTIRRENEDGTTRFPFAVVVAPEA
jgi:HK97 family phage major capsid protein